MQSMRHEMQRDLCEKQVKDDFILNMFKTVNEEWSKM